MTSDMFHDLFGGKPREMETKITQREMDLAASIQKVTEDVVLKLARSIAHDTSCENLCLRWRRGLELCGKWHHQQIKVFKEIWIQPAAGDAGGAVGAALAVWHIHFKKNEKCIRVEMACLARSWGRVFLMMRSKRTSILSGHLCRIRRGQAS